MVDSAIVRKASWKFTTVNVYLERDCVAAAGFPINSIRIPKLRLKGTYLAIRELAWSIVYKVGRDKKDIKGVASDGTRTHKGSDRISRQVEDRGRQARP